MQYAAHLVRYIQSHGHTANVNAEGKIEAIEVFTKFQNGKNEVSEELVTLEPNFKAVRDWLGY